MKIYINRRKPGTQNGGGRNGSGWIFGGLERVGVLTEESEIGEFMEDPRAFLLENYGPGKYAVSAQGYRGQFEAIFSGEVGTAGEPGAYFEEEAVFA